MINEVDIMPSFNALTLSHQFMEQYVKEGAFCIDATAGCGGDTAFLAELSGESGKVFSFDVQKQALEITYELLTHKNLSDRVRLILDGHEHMEKYAQSDSVDFICFNFGWLPGGDHNIFTHADTSIAAIDAALRLLKKGGAMSLCIYYGRNNGYGERDAILKHLRDIDPKLASVLVCEFVNRPNAPAIPVFVLKGV